MARHSRRSADPRPTVADAMDPCDYQIADDSTVDQADDVLCSAHIDY
ncbi:hypothetical protein [Kitasatospora sp. NPDC005748]